MVKTKTYHGTPGETMILDSDLAFVNIIRVTRSGKVHSKIDYDAVFNSGLVFKHSPYVGGIEFNPDNPFNGPLMGRPNRALMEKVTVIYKTP